MNNKDEVGIFKKLMISAAAGQSLALLRQFLQKTSFPHKAQEQTLLDKLKRNCDSEWGKRFDFNSINNIKTFQEKVPLSTYEDFLPYIEKLKLGNTQALLGSREKLLGFGLTSGTTGEPKFIPFTPCFIREYKHSTLLFARRMVEDIPGVMKGKILSVFAPAREYKTKGGTWCGSISGWIAENQIPIIRAFYALPNEVMEIKDVHTRYYTLMRIGLTKNVGTLITANPSTILNLIKLADQEKTEIIRDIHDGTLYVKGLVEESICQRIKSHLKKDPLRAHELEKFAQENNSFIPRHYWPNLKLIACWKGGTLFTYLDQFPNYFSESTCIKDIGLLATEGRLSIPILPGIDAGCPTINSVFFEFIPEEDEKQPSPHLLLVDELELGKKYFLVITTSSGFTRYKINDLVQVVDFLNSTPLIYFLNKGEHFSSLTGEKLSEYQVVMAVDDITKEFNLHFSYFTLCPCWSEIPYYVLLAEEHEMGDKSLWPGFITRLDERLQELNIEYHCKRKSGRLALIRLNVLARHCFESRHKMDMSLEGRMEQYKHVYLSPSIDYHKNFPVKEVI